MGSVISNIFKVRYVTIFCIIILLCILSINTGQCRPERRHRHGHRRVRTTTPAPEEETIDPESEKLIQPCFDDPTTMDLCQRCAKESKSKTVFPLCCSNVERVKEWCKEYIYFGL
ncbi:hypothetical protein Bhyg_00480, partial [Pseudolycoriella hygida]